MSRNDDIRVRQYDGATIGFHWITAPLVALLWCLGQTLDWFPRGAPRVAALSTHIVLGLALVRVLLLRLFWRGSAGRHLPPADPGVMGVVAQLGHTALYLLLIAVLAVGLGVEWLRGDTIYGVFSLPSLAPTDRAVRHAFTGFHNMLANILVIVAGLHALAALVHHYLLRDGVLRRMVPGLR